MDLDKKFVAAVDVIKNLPTNGPFETSNEMKLQFYAYYKQATVGPCKNARPGFWDLVGRYFEIFSYVKATLLKIPKHLI